MEMARIQQFYSAPCGGRAFTADLRKKNRFNQTVILKLQQNVSADSN